MSRPIRLGRESILKSLGFLIYVYIFIGFMVVPCFNTLASVFSTVRPDGSRDPLAVIRFFFAGNMGKYVLNSLKLAVGLVITVNIVGVSIVLLTEYFDIKGARILRLGYMTTMIYSGVALVTGYLFLYAGDGIITTQLVKIFPDMNKDWFSGFRQREKVELSSLPAQLLLGVPVAEVTAEQSGPVYLRVKDYDVYTGTAWESSNGRQDTLAGTGEERGMVTVNTLNLQKNLHS